MLRVLKSWATFFMLVLGLFFLFGPISAFAASPYDESIEKDAKSIEHLLITPCCWGGTVAEHSSSEALQIKSEIREMLKSGKGKEAILAFYETKYGERILSSPKKKGLTSLLWVFPPLAIVLGGIILVPVLRRLRSKKSSSKEEANSQVENTSDSDDSAYRKQIEDELYG